MAARAIWKGVLKLGTTRLPVKLYSAVQDRTVRFHVLDDRQKKRVKQHMIDPDTGAAFELVEPPCGLALGRGFLERLLHRHEVGVVQLLKSHADAQRLLGGLRLHGRGAADQRGKDGGGFEKILHGAVSPGL